MATPGMGLGGGGRGGLNMMLAGGLPGGGSIQDLIAQLQGRLGEGSPQPGGDDGDAPMSTQPVPVGINVSPRNQVPTPDRPPSPGGGGLPYKEPPAPEPQEAEPPKMGGTDDDFRNIPDNPPEEMKPQETAMQRASRISRQAPSGPRRTASPGLQGRPQPSPGGARESAVLGAKPARKLDPSGRQPPGPRDSKGPVLGAKPAQKPGAPQITTLPAPATPPEPAGADSWLEQNMPEWMRRQGFDVERAKQYIENQPNNRFAQMYQEQLAQQGGEEPQRVTGPGLQSGPPPPGGFGGGGGPQLAQKPAQVPGGNGFDPTSWAGENMPDWMRERGISPQQALEWAQNNPDRPFGQMLQEAQGGGQQGFGGGGMVDEKIAIPWLQENMPRWMKERGVSAEQALNFLKNNPDSPIAQKYAAAGLG